MNNFNRNDLQKYEKIAKDLFKNAPRINPRIKNIRKKNIIYAVALGGLAYLSYKIYDHKKHKNQHYIDMFQFKKQVAAQARWADLKQKLSLLSLQKNRSYATDTYQKMLTEKFINLESKLNIETNAQQQVKQQINKRNKIKKAYHNKQLVLSTSSKSNISLGSVFKMHTKKYMTTLTNKGQILQKTYIIPLMIFDVPFFYKKKQQTKKVVKTKSKGMDKVIQNKGKFRLNSQCQQANYWNLFTRPAKEESLTTGQEIEIQNTKLDDYLQNKQQIQEKQKQKQKRKIIEIQSEDERVKRQKRELLFQCRNRIRKVQENLINRLKQNINRKWVQSKKHQNDKYQYQNTMWGNSWQNK